MLAALAPRTQISLAKTIPLGCSLHLILLGNFAGLIPKRRGPPTMAVGSGNCSSRSGQRQLAPQLLQMRGHDCPSNGLRPLWRVDPDLERDPDGRQHATQHNDLERRHCLRPK